MQVRLNIRTQPALIGLKVKKARAPVRTELAPFSIEKTDPVFQIKNKLPQIVLDSTAGWAGLGFPQPTELVLRLRDQSWRDATAATARMAEEGDRLAAFWEPGNKIEELAAEFTPAAPVLLYPVSPNPVAIEVDPGATNINYQRGSAAVRLDEAPNPRSYEPGAVRVYLRQQAAIEITWTGLDVVV
ncbi:MAG: hypothetical protein GX952_01235 [Firmicutes bacterium]|nr:hypothetical protein [Bacillota bacterium]